MTLKDFLRKRDHIKDGRLQQPPHRDVPNHPQLTIIRSDTHTQEIISTPSFGPDSSAPPDKTLSGHPSKRLSRFRSLSGSSVHSQASNERKRISSIFHRRSNSQETRGLANILSDLPKIDDTLDDSEKQARWVQRAVLLTDTYTRECFGIISAGLLQQQQVDIVQGTDNIQEAIKLHEFGDLGQSTAMLKRLANPKNSDNPMSQVLYGLSLRHGWGTLSDPALAVAYIMQAANNAGMVESQALASGMKNGGPARGELVLAIYELGNCCSRGLGIEKDTVSGFLFYEIAANLGDGDAMNDTGRCYEEGIGTKKDKYKASFYFRMAEDNGNKLVGNSWIWKEKYNPCPTRQQD